MPEIGPVPYGADPADVVRLLIHDWRWQSFDEQLNGREDDFPIAGWRRIWIEDRPDAELGLLEVREWFFSIEHPDAALYPRPAWEARVVPTSEEAA